VADLTVSNKSLDISCRLGAGDGDQYPPHTGDGSGPRLSRAHWSPGTGDHPRDLSRRPPIIALRAAQYGPFERSSPMTHLASEMRAPARN